MRGAKAEWPRSQEYIALDYNVAVHDVFGPAKPGESADRYDAIELVVGYRKKVLSQATVAELLTKARLRFSDGEVKMLMSVLRFVYVIASTTDELCIAYSDRKREAQRRGVDPVEHRTWTAAICETTKIFVFADDMADYACLLSRDQIVSWQAD